MTLSQSASKTNAILACEGSVNMRLWLIWDQVGGGGNEAFDIAGIVQALVKRGDGQCAARLAEQEADHRHLLRPCRERSRRRAGRAISGITFGRMRLLAVLAG
jgi:hypothetical protein